MLPDSAVNAQHFFVFLIKYRIQRNGGLACLPISQNQLALAATNWNERIDNLDAGLQRYRNGCTVHYRRGGALDRQTLCGNNRCFSVAWTPERIDDSSNQLVTH